MARTNNRQSLSETQFTGQAQEFAEILANLDDAALLNRLQAYRRYGRTGYPPRALWRAYFCSFLLNLSSTNDLIRILRHRPDLRALCGFEDDELPVRTTFNRFLNRLKLHVDLVEQISAGLVNKIREWLPDIGQQVAIDGTAVYAHSRGKGDRETWSDQEADWGYKHSARSKNDKAVLHFGYKVHMVADANHGLPLAHFTTAANASEMKLMPRYIEHAEELYDWFKPEVVIADKGYDSLWNHEWLNHKGIKPVIPLRRLPKGAGEWHDGIYTDEGAPTCVGQVPMTYVRTDPEQGYLYRCTGCHLASKGKGASRFCNTENWENWRTTRNLRLVCAIRRGSEEWEETYSRRQHVERVFKGMKESRRLERHHVRGLAHVSLHAQMSALSFQATALANLQQGRTHEVRWMKKRVA